MEMKRKRIARKWGGKKIAGKLQVIERETQGKIDKAKTQVECV
jgi:hypothetical protein